MSTPLQDYKALIDGLVQLSHSVAARRVREGQPWPQLPENKALNTFLSKLSAEQRETLADLLQKTFEAGIHQVLAYLNDEIDLGGLRLTRDGREVPVTPFGTELYYDWVCRLAGDPWPQPESA